ncbi:unnamed protein product [Oikopleura dioica]|uniref:Uncharacterized protein n=1 Tax=Oikopleura dioica TaxID=34765 RepID=E4XEW2_OIKDI|nr:unnamed protein product [Oikopleura dioica]
MAMFYLGGLSSLLDRRLAACAISALRVSTFMQVSTFSATDSRPFMIPANSPREYRAQPSSSNSSGSPGCLRSVFANLALVSAASSVISSRISLRDVSLSSPSLSSVLDSVRDLFPSSWAT